MEPKLRLPFNGDFPITFAFAAVSEDEEIKKKFSEWGIVGHHGIDYGLPEGTEVVASDTGKVIQSGENGDFGISVTLEHSWGQSIYAHLMEAKVSVGDEPKTGDVIGLSGKTGAAFGEHLHFGVKLKDADTNNGYLGFIDPSPYFAKLEESTEQSRSISELLQKANEKRKQRREDNLNQIAELAKKKQIDNQDVRDLLQVSQSTASNYLSELVKSGKLKVEKKAKATIYRI